MFPVSNQQYQLATEMKKHFLLPLLLIAFSCHDSSIEPDNSPNLRALSEEERQVASGANAFAFNLYRKLQNETPTNTFISPLSVSTALAMILNGASDETKQSILNTIDFGGFTPAQVNKAYFDLTALLLSMDRKVKMTIANSVWYKDEYKVHADFSSVIRNFYDGEVRGLDFSDPATKDVINSWVESKTNNRIKDILTNISRDEVMYIINAIYFKGDWTYQFDKTKTYKAAFYGLNNAVSEVDMMFSKGVKLDQYATDQLQVLSVPYGNGQFNFTMIVPADPNKLTEIANKLTSEQLDQWIAQSDSLTVILEMPRFKMNWKKDLLTTLEEMGMAKKGFPKLFETALSLQISKVIHQSFIDVNEEGSEAAAATVIGVEFTSIPSKPARITIDKPFLFMIREKHSNAILFLGQLVDPTSAQ